MAFGSGLPGLNFDKVSKLKMCKGNESFYDRAGLTFKTSLLVNKD